MNKKTNSTSNESEPSKLNNAHESSAPTSNLGKSDPFFKREQSNYDNPVASREYLIELFKKHQRPLAFKEVCTLVNAVDEDSRIGIQRRLRAMERERQLSFINKDKKYALPSGDTEALIQGQVIGHRDGYGFLRRSDEGKDLFIPQNFMSTLLHDDVVEGVTGKQDRKGRQEFRPIRIIASRSDPIVGRFFTEQGVSLVIPDDNRISHEIIIPKEHANGARQGHVVIVEITQRPARQSNPLGKIIEVLGDHMAPGMEIETALRNFDIPHNWPQSVTNFVQKIPETVTQDAKQNRKDLTKLPLVTIDGEDARDFDDAVYCNPLPNGGWKLYVAIADVSSYVKIGTALDVEAQTRATSVYFPEKVIPMLPEKLSNGLCSLNPNVDRLCMVCEMEISSTGELKTYQFYEAVMNSFARLTYNKVWAILNNDPLLKERYEERVEDLENLYKLYRTLKKARTHRGAIEFESKETKFVFNAQRKIDHIIPIERNDAHKIIEECMIMANVSAAKYIENNNAEALFRVHDKPDEDRLKTFRSYLSEVGIGFTASNDVNPNDFAEVASKITNRIDKELIQTMLLRSMKQAVYDGANIGHFGLSLPAYAHFTSPIRRYPDLIVHRVIKAILNKQANQKLCKGAKFYTEEEITQLGEQCSMAERRADDATRDVADWLKCEFMQDHVGDVFEGVIASVTNFGLFVRIVDYQIDGLIHITALGNDYFHYDDIKQWLIGENSGLVYRLGDVIKIKVAAVNLDERKIDLLPEAIVNIKSAKRQSKKSNKSKGRQNPSGSGDKKRANKQSTKSSVGKSKKSKGARSKLRRK